MQYRAIRYAERLAECDAVASVGSKGDSYDNAMAEALNSLYKADWYNERRLHGELGHVPPAEHEATYWAANRAPVLLETR